MYDASLAYFEILSLNKILKIQCFKVQIEYVIIPFQEKTIVA